MLLCLLFSNHLFISVILPPHLLYLLPFLSSQYTQNVKQYFFLTHAEVLLFSHLVGQGTTGSRLLDIQATSHIVPSFSSIRVMHGPILKGKNILRIFSVDLFLL